MHLANKPYRIKLEKKNLNKLALVHLQVTRIIFSLRIMVVHNYCVTLMHNVARNIFDNRQAFNAAQTDRKLPRYRLFELPDFYRPT